MKAAAATALALAAASLTVLGWKRQRMFKGHGYHPAIITFLVPLPPLEAEANSEWQHEFPAAPCMPDERDTC
jgi:hypothetical protein